MNEVKVSYDMDSFMNSANSLAFNKGSDVYYIKLEKDKPVTVRFLPPPSDHPEYKRSDLFVLMSKHFGFIDENGKNKVINCTKVKYGSCPICSEYELLMNDGNRERAAKIRVQHKFAYTVLDSQEKIGILELDPKCQNVLIDTIKSYRRRNPNFIPYHLHEGHWIDITKSKELVPSKGKFQPNVYTITLDIEKKPVSDEILKNYSAKYIWPEKTNIIYTPKEVEMAMNGDWSFIHRYNNDEVLNFPTKDFEAEAAIAKKHSSHVSQSSSSIAPNINSNPISTAPIQKKSPLSKGSAGMLSPEAQAAMMNDILND